MYVERSRAAGAVICSMALLVVSPAMGQEFVVPEQISEHRPQQTLTLGQLEQIALVNNPTICQAASRAEAVRGKWQQVGLKPNPRLGYFADEVGNGGTGGLHGVVLSQQVVTGGKLELNRLAAEMEITRAEELWSVQRQRVLTDTRRVFYETLVAQQAVDVARSLVDIGETAVKTAESLLIAREVRQLDVLQANVEANNARIRLAQAETQLRASWRRLEAVIGTPCMMPSRLVGDPVASLPELDWEAALCRIYYESPELRSAYAEVDRARWQLERELAGQKQNVTLEAAAGFDDSTNDAFGSFRFSMPIPFHDANQGNISRAAAEVAFAERDVERLRLSIQNRLAAAYSRYDAARRQFRLYEDRIVPDSKRSLEIIRSGYPAEFNYLNLITAQREYFQAELGRLQTLQTYRGEAASIEGMLLQDSLEELR